MAPQQQTNTNSSYSLLDVNRYSPRILIKTLANFDTSKVDFRNKVDFMKSLKLHCMPNNPTQLTSHSNSNIDNEIGDKSALNGYSLPLSNQKCAVCGDSFKKSSDIKKHKIMHRFENNTENSDSDKQGDCSDCSSSSKNLESVNNSTKTHKSKKNKKTVVLRIGTEVVSKRSCKTKYLVDKTYDENCNEITSSNKRPVEATPSTSFQSISHNVKDESPIINTEDSNEKWEFAQLLAEQMVNEQMAIDKKSNVCVSAATDQEVYVEEIPCIDISDSEDGVHLNQNDPLVTDEGFTDKYNYCDDEVMIIEDNAVPQQTGLSEEDSYDISISGDDSAYGSDSNNSGKRVSPNSITGETLAIKKRRSNKTQIPTENTQRQATLANIHVPLHQFK